MKKIIKAASATSRKFRGHINKLKFRGEYTDLGFREFAPDQFIVQDGNNLIWLDNLSGLFATFKDGVEYAQEIMDIISGNDDPSILDEFLNSHNITRDDSYSITVEIL